MTRDDIIRMAHETDCLDEQHYGSVWANKLERFAELIVKETIDHMTAQMFYYSINGSKNLSFSQAIDKTKEHFGVKE
jgi:peptide deformylase